MFKEARVEIEVDKDGKTLCDHRYINLHNKYEPGILALHKNFDGNIECDLCNAVFSEESGNILFYKGYKTPTRKQISLRKAGILRSDIEVAQKRLNDMKQFSKEVEKGNW